MIWCDWPGLQQSGGVVEQIRSLQRANRIHPVDLRSYKPTKHCSAFAAIGTRARRAGGSKGRRLQLTAYELVTSYSPPTAVGAVRGWSPERQPQRFTTVVHAAAHCGGGGAQKTEGNTPYLRLPSFTRPTEKNANCPCPGALSSPEPLLQSASHLPSVCFLEWPIPSDITPQQ